MVGKITVVDVTPENIVVSARRGVLHRAENGLLKTPCCPP
jgi:hypothetical protein